MDTYKSLPLSALRESPFNPRKSFPEDALQELATSIKSQGVMQPIVVRLVVDLAEHDFTTPAYEIVFGHRRSRAAALAGLDSVPVIIRELDDEAASIAQVHENTKRADVTALEEADSFEHLRKTHGMSADAIAAAVGKSRSYVYGRLKLASVAPAVREACERQGLSPETALDLARMPGAALQTAALKQIRDKMIENPSQPVMWLSVRESRRRVESLYTTRLGEKAKFDPTDPELQGGACTTCPRRAGNAPDLAALPEDTCTDPDCFGEKTAQHQLRIKQAHQGRVDAAKMLGLPVIEGQEALTIWARNYAGCLIGYTAAGEMVDEDDAPEHGTFAEVLLTMPDAPKTTLIWNPHDATDLQEYLSDADVAAVLKHLGLEDDYETSPAPGGTWHTGFAPEERPTDWSAAEVLTTDRGAWLEVRKAAILNVANLPRTAECLRAVVLSELDQAGDFGLAGELLGWQARHDAAHVEPENELSSNEIYTRLIEAASADELAALITAVAVNNLLGTQLSHYAECHAKAKERVLLARRYGAQLPDDDQAEADTAVAVDPAASEADASEEDSATQEEAAESLA